MILSSVVMFLPNINPKLADLTPAETIQFLNRYFFWSALFVFPAFVALRLVAARIRRIDGTQAIVGIAQRPRARAGAVVRVRVSDHRATAPCGLEQAPRIRDHGRETRARFRVLVDVALEEIEHERKQTPPRDIGFDAAS